MTETRVLLREAIQRLRVAEVPSPEHDARVLLAHALETDLNQLVLIEEITPEQAGRFTDLVDRRAQRIPLQHLTGVAHFRTVTVEVGPGVFTPRPETELLAGWAIDRARECSAPVVVDLCTGSGAIARAIAEEVPDAQVHAVELDPEAFAWAQRNLTGTGVALSEGDLAQALPELDGKVDVVVCNPPYVPLTAFDGVDQEAREHDPALALFSGSDGLAAMRALEGRAARLLKPGGWLGAEHADVQGESAPAIFASTGNWTQVRDHPDLAGRARFVTARLAR